MATVNQQPKQAAATTVPSDFDQLMSREVSFTPLGESEPIKISMGMARDILAIKSKSGNVPQVNDLTKFLMLCKSRALNPYVGDAFLIGYDSERDGTKWNLVTAIQALRKRAEGNPHYRGTEYGVIVRGGDGGIVERPGTLIDDNEALLGGWAKVYRDDRSTPAYASVKQSVYDTKRSRWAKDPGGMIAKVAEAAGLRQAFPSDLAGLYIRDEFGGDETATHETKPAGIAGLKRTLGADDHAVIVQSPRPDSDEDAIQDVRKPSQPTAEELEEWKRDQAASGKLFDDREEYR